MHEQLSSNNTKKASYEWVEKNLYQRDSELRTCDGPTVRRTALQSDFAEVLASSGVSRAVPAFTPMSKLFELLDPTS